MHRCLHPCAGHRSEPKQFTHHFFCVVYQSVMLLLGIGIVPKPITICYYVCAMFTHCCSIGMPDQATGIHLSQP